MMSFAEAKRCVKFSQRQALTQKYSVKSVWKIFRRTSKKQLSERMALQINAATITGMTRRLMKPSC